LFLQNIKKRQIVELTFEWLKEEKSICRGNLISILNALRISDVDDLKEANMKMILTIYGLLKEKAGEKFINALKLLEIFTFS
jgi:hypothetical protein